MNKHAGLFGATLALFAGPAGAGNLVANPDFDSGPANWTNLGGANVTIDAADGSPAAPSLHVVALSPNSGATVASDCIVIDASLNVDLIANIKVHTGSQEVLVNAFATNDCSSGGLGPAGNASSTPTIDTWDQESTLSFALPPTTQGVQVVLVVGPTFSTDVSDVRFDHLQFGPAGTTPVTLQSFDVR